MSAVLNIVLAAFTSKYILGTHFRLGWPVIAYKYLNYEFRVHTVIFKNYIWDKNNNNNMSALKQ